MRNFDARLEKPLEHFNISLEMANKLAKKIVYRHTLIDGEGYLNVCVKDKNNCRRTYIHIDKDFLVNRLNYNWAKLGLSGGLYDGFRDVLEDVWGFDVDFSIFITTNFIFPEIYDVYFKPLEPDNINESFRNHIDNEEKQKKYLDHIYNDLIKNTKWRDASFRDIDLYDGKCKSLQIGINWSTWPPSFSYIPVCLQKYLTDTWGLTYEEVKELFWGRYDKHVINMNKKGLQHQPYNLIESIDRNKKYKLTKEQTVHLISLYEYMDYDKESAIEDLKDLVSYLNNLKSPLTLYRIICSDSEEEINLSKVGSHYSLNKKNLITNHYRRGSVAGDCRGEKVFLLTVSADKSIINVMETLSNNILYPHEEEITLKGEGYGVNVIKVEEL